MILKQVNLKTQLLAYPCNNSIITWKTSVLHNKCGFSMELFFVLWQQSLNERNHDIKNYQFQMIKSS